MRWDPSPLAVNTHDSRKEPVAAGTEEVAVPPATWVSTRPLAAAIR